LQPTARLEVVQSGPISMVRMHKAIKGQWPEIFWDGWLS
jgi:hypothetical protein